MAVPGHTPGSIAPWLARHQVPLTGDAAARDPDGTVTCGVFNASRPQAATSFRRLAGFSAAAARLGHGEPLTHDAAAVLQAAAGTGRHARGAPASPMTGTRYPPNPGR